MPELGTTFKIFGAGACGASTVGDSVILNEFIAGGGGGKGDGGGDGDDKRSGSIIMVDFGACCRLGFSAAPSPPEAPKKLPLVFRIFDVASTEPRSFVSISLKLPSSAFRSISNSARSMEDGECEKSSILETSVGAAAMVGAAWLMSNSAEQKVEERRRMRSLLSLPLSQLEEANWIIDLIFGFILVVIAAVLLSCLLSLTLLLGKAAL